jgi:hypothetical protein
MIADAVEIDEPAIIWDTYYTFASRLGAAPAVEIDEIIAAAPGVCLNLLTQRQSTLHV